MGPVIVICTAEVSRRSIVIGPLNVRTVDTVKVALLNICVEARVAKYYMESKSVTWYDRSHT